MARSWSLGIPSSMMLKFCRRMGVVLLCTCAQLSHAFGSCSRPILLWNWARSALRCRGRTPYLSSRAASKRARRARRMDEETRLHSSAVKNSHDSSSSVASLEESASSPVVLRTGESASSSSAAAMSGTAWPRSHLRVESSSDSSASATLRPRSPCVEVPSEAYFCHQDRRLCVVIVCMARKQRLIMTVPLYNLFKSRADEGLPKLEVEGLLKNRSGFRLPTPQDEASQLNSSTAPQGRVHADDAVDGHRQRHGPVLQGGAAEVSKEPSSDVFIRRHGNHVGEAIQSRVHRRIIFHGRHGRQSG